MKKGCLKIVILIPIILGIVIYIIDKYGEDFWNNRKAEALVFVKETVDEKFKEFVPNKYADSLKTEVINYFNTLKDRKIEDISNQVSEFYAEMKNIVKDSIVSELDYKKLKSILDNNAIKKKI